MFVIDISYIVPLERVEVHLEAHVAWLKQAYAKGYFLASGRKVPRTGGGILAKMDSLEALEAFIETDPFRKANVSNVKIIHFVSSMVVNGLDESLKEV